MIYRIPPVDEPVEQGDLVENCPVAFVAGFHPAHLDAVEVGCELRRVVEMTQTCDLANRKATLATVAVIHDAHLLVERGLLTTADVRGPVRAARVYGWYFLPASGEHGLPEMIVDFRQLFSVPLDLLTTLCRHGHRRSRIQVPYREHLARHFAETYARIGLPEPYVSE